MATSILNHAARRRSLSGGCDLPIPAGASLPGFCLSAVLGYAHRRASASGSRAIIWRIATIGIAEILRLNLRTRPG